jgi:hypothetical protein
MLAEQFAYLLELVDGSGHARSPCRHPNTPVDHMQIPGELQDNNRTKCEQSVGKD